MSRAPKGVMPPSPAQGSLEPETGDGDDNARVGSPPPPGINCLPAVALREVFALVGKTSLLTLHQVVPVVCRLWRALCTHSPGVPTFIPDNKRYSNLVHGYVGWSEEKQDRCRAYLASFGKADGLRRFYTLAEINLVDMGDVLDNEMLVRMLPPNLQRLCVYGRSRLDGGAVAKINAKCPSLPLMVSATCIVCRNLILSTSESTIETCGCDQNEVACPRCKVKCDCGCLYCDHDDEDDDDDDELEGPNIELCDRCEKNVCSSCSHIEYCSKCNSNVCIDCERVEYCGRCHTSACKDCVHFDFCECCFDSICKSCHGDVTWYLDDSPTYTENGRQHTCGSACATCGAKHGLPSHYGW